MLPVNSLSLYAAVWPHSLIYSLWDEWVNALSSGTATMKLMVMCLEQFAIWISHLWAVISSLVLIMFHFQLLAAIATEFILLLERQPIPAWHAWQTFIWCIFLLLRLAKGWVHLNRTVNLMINPLRVFIADQTLWNLFCSLPKITCLSLYTPIT